LNIYQLHTDPEQLDHYNERYKLPGEAWNFWIHSLNYKDTTKQEFFWEWVLKDPESAYLCALWQGIEIPALEKIIKWDAKWARKYATSVMKQRWPEAEEMIMTDDDEWHLYAYEFGLDR